MSWDAIVIGAGGVGSAALYHLARRGLKALALDRFLPPHAQGSSHGDTRLIRLAYFEDPAYVPLLRRSYALWDALAEARGEQLFVRSGLLQAGPPGRGVVAGARRSAALHGLELEVLDSSQAASRFPWFQPPPKSELVFEQNAGYLRVEACIRAHLELACAAGAEVRVAAVERLEQRGGEFVLRAGGEELRAPRVLVCAGVWARAVLGEWLPMRVTRQPLLWYPAPRHPASAPGFLIELPAGAGPPAPGAEGPVFYGFPALEGQLKVAQHGGGAEVQDPLDPERSLLPSDRRPVEAFLASRLPGIETTPSRHHVCMYALTPDCDFVVDEHPQLPGLHFAAGLSGHGFKMASGLGEALAERCLGAPPSVELGYLGLKRFRAEG